MTITVKTMDEYIEDLTENSSPSASSRVLTKETSETTKYTEKDDLSPNVSVPKDIYLGGFAYTGTGLIKIQLSQAMALTSVVLGAGTAPTGSALTYDINYHATDPDSATSIFSSLPSIAATAHTGSSTSFSTSSLAKDGWIVIDCDAVGSSSPGKDVTVSLRQD